MPGGEHAGPYGTMDVGRLALQGGLVFGNVTLCIRLEDQDFHALTRLQGRETQKIYQDS